MADRPFDIVTGEEIAAGRATAAYFLRTEAVLDHAGRAPEVVAEVGRAGPDWHVLAGLADAAHLLSGLPVDLYAAPEGTLFRDGPIARIEGPYRAFARFEQSLLGFLAPASGIATGAMGLRAAAGDRTVLSFATRRRHPATAAMIERSALVGGVDGIGNVAGGEVIGVEAGGTMPHALSICFGDAGEAFAAYDAALPSDVPRTMLCDTFGDERDESVLAAERLGDALEAVRLDTTGSRRGNMRAIVEEVRWELDTRGFEDVEIVVSGGVDAAEIAALRDVADGFGVGGALANAPPVDLSVDLVEVDGERRSKRGVKSGAKEVYRDGLDETVVPKGETTPGDRLLEPVVRDGEVVMDFSIDDAAARVREGIERLRERGELPEHAAGAG